jgi:hypothetical protein
LRHPHTNANAKCNTNGNTVAKPNRDDYPQYDKYPDPNANANANGNSECDPDTDPDANA